MGEEILKEKDEIRQYLKNLGIEYRFSCFSEKNPEGCQLLGDYLAQIDHDYTKANKVLKDNCDIRNYGRSCSSYGLNLLYGRGNVKNVQEAVKYFVKACENDDATGCDFAGKIYGGFEASLHKHITPDPERGLKYLLKGCNSKSSSQFFESSESCYAAAYMLGSQKNTSIAKDPKRALELGIKACEMGQMLACKLVSRLFKEMDNEEMSKKYLQRYNQIKKQTTDNTGIEMQRT